MWEDVVELLHSRDQIGPKLRLRCSRHEETVMEVSAPGDFETLAPEGGCTELCNKRLDCGHACEYLCHADSMHKHKECRRRCERGRTDCGHACAKRCYEDCGKGLVIVKDILLPCGHFLSKPPCWLSRDLSHTQAKCTTRVVRMLPVCKHDAEMLCGDDPTEFKCLKRCRGDLPCRHLQCSNPCFRCPETAAGNESVSRHAPCQELCGKNHKACSHRCRRVCHEGDCGSCSQQCQLQCVHSKCRRVCGEYCVPCAEQCTWQCEHMGRCEMPCGAPCDRLPCNKRCSQVLECGHQCPSICGEICPGKEYCQVCCSTDKREAEVEMIEMTTYENIDVEIDPIIVLACGHFYTSTFLDGCMEMEKVYRQDSDGDFTESVSTADMVLSLKNCPECRMPICGIQRYNRIFKCATLNSMLRGIIIRSQESYISIAKNVAEFESQLEKARVEKLRELIPLTNSQSIATCCSSK